MTARKAVGWTVKAKNKKGEFVAVSATFETHAGAEGYLALWLKTYPDTEAYIEQHAAEQGLAF